MYSIYAAVNGLTSEAYVGCSSYSLNKRRSCHESASKIKPYYKFAQAIRAYGKEYFTWLVLEETEDKKYAHILEKKYIEELDTINNGYNTKDSNEHKKALSTALKKSWEKRRAHAC